MRFRGGSNCRMGSLPERRECEAPVVAPRQVPTDGARPANDRLSRPGHRARRWFSPSVVYPRKSSK